MLDSDGIGGAMVGAIVVEDRIGIGGAADVEAENPLIRRGADDDVPPPPFWAMKTKYPAQRAIQITNNPLLAVATSYPRRVIAPSALDNDEI